MRKTITLSLAALLACSALPAVAQSAGDWTIGVGLGYVMPDSGNGTVAGAQADIGDNAQPTITFEYFVRDNLGIEVLAATPFKHSILLNGTKVASTQHLPPTISLQYHFETGSKLTPFFGAGVNYTKFFNVDSTGPLAGADLNLDDSYGLAVHAGIDYKISEHGALRTDVRWIDIDTDVELVGTGDVGTAHIDPWVFGISYVHNF